MGEKVCVCGKVLCVSGGGCIYKGEHEWERLCKRVCGREREGVQVRVCEWGRGRVCECMGVREGRVCK